MPSPCWATKPTMVPGEGVGRRGIDAVELQNVGVGIDEIHGDASGDRATCLEHSAGVQVDRSASGKTLSTGGNRGGRLIENVAADEQRAAADVECRQAAETQGCYGLAGGNRDKVDADDIRFTGVEGHRARTPVRIGGEVDGSAAHPGVGRGWRQVNEGLREIGRLGATEGCQLFRTGGCTVGDPKFAGSHRIGRVIVKARNLQQSLAVQRRFVCDMSVGALDEQRCPGGGSIRHP